MEPEMMNQILERTEAKQYAAVMRHLSRNNRRLRIPGFSLLEKAPVRFVANTARTNQEFRKALYESFSAVILDGAAVDLAQNIDTIKSGLPREQWVGLAAHLLMKDEEKYEADVMKLLASLGSEEEPAESEPPAQTEPEVKPDKKEERFREKYLRVKNENGELAAELERCRVQRQEDAAEIERLKANQTELEERCAAYLAEISGLSEEKMKLHQKLDKMTKEAKEAQKTRQSELEERCAVYLDEIGLLSEENAQLLSRVEEMTRNVQEKQTQHQTELDSQYTQYINEINALSREKTELLARIGEMNTPAQEKQTAAPVPAAVDLRIFAPNCRDLLKKYADAAALDFDGSVDMGAAKAAEQYDEIWVFPDVVPYAAYRVLKKWKKEADGKVFVFQTAADLVAHAEKVLQADGRRE